MVRDTGFEPVTPTVSRYSGLLERRFFSVGDSIWTHANPCENEKCYSEMLQLLSLLLPCHNVNREEKSQYDHRRSLALVCSFQPKLPKSCV